MKALEVLARSFAERHPEDTARALEAIDAEEASKLLRRLPEGPVGSVLERMAPHALGPILALYPPDELQKLLVILKPKHAVGVLQQLEEASRDAVLKEMPQDRAKPLLDLLKYPPETAASMMEPQVTTIPIDVTVKEAVNILRKAKRQTLYYLYVTDRDRKLLGILGLRDLLLASTRDRIEPLVRKEVTSVSASADREEVTTLMRERKFLALPVVDGEGRLLGVVRPEDAMVAAQQEAFEDVQKMVGAGGDERALSPVSTVVKKRLGWLYINLITAFMAASVVGIFEETISKVTALAVLLPIVAGQGGNTGAQALAIVMRGLALREIIPGSVSRLVFKEATAGFINGLAVAVVTALAVFLWDGRWALSMVIGLAMIVNMAAAAIAGTVIPLILQAMKRDPAQSSSIFMTTVTDIVGFASFLGFAMIFQSMLVEP